LPPRLDAPGELAIFAARSFDIPLSRSASYCFSFLTFARLFGIAGSSRDRVSEGAFPPIRRENARSLVAFRSSGAGKGRGGMSSNGHAHPDYTRIVLRPVGSGLPLGFFSFAIGMLLLGCQGIGWIPVQEQHDVGLLLVTFVFPLELIATVFAFLARDTLGGTTLGLFTTSWLALGWLQHSAPPGATSVALGIYLFGFATAALLLATLSTLGKPLFSALLLTATARMVVAGVYEVGGSHELLHIAGALAIALSAVAMYGGVALGLEDARQREVLPLFRRGGADRAFQGYERQLERLQAEQGIRQQL
jgi:succinate-acetate transporter protein